MYAQEFILKKCLALHRHRIVPLVKISIFLKNNILQNITS